MLINIHFAFEAEIALNQLDTNMASIPKLPLLFGFLIKMYLGDDFCPKESEEADCSSSKPDLELAEFLTDFLYEFELNSAVMLVSEDSLSELSFNSSRVF